MGAVPDFETRDIPDESFAGFQRRSAAADQTLEEYVQAWPMTEAAKLVTVEDLQRLGRLAADLESQEVMTRAWDSPSGRQSAG